LRLIRNLNKRRYRGGIPGKEFNFGLLEFYRLKKLHPDFYDYIPNQRSRKRFNELDFYSSGVYSNHTIDPID